MLILAVLFSAFSIPVAAEDTRGAIDSLKTAYDDLPPHGKLATGAVFGFISSRVAVKTVVGGLKFAGAAFIV